MDTVSGELWTSKQRQMHPLHYVISYRASFKPELPEYFIEKYTEIGNVVYDPWCGRGTTPLQAALMGRAALASDVSPVAVAITAAKCAPVDREDAERVIYDIEDYLCDYVGPVVSNESDLLTFYHPATLRELFGLREYFQRYTSQAARFVQLLAASRLHGHSDGFFSVYTFPQTSVSAESQRRLNEKHNRSPEYRPVVPRITRKLRSLGRDYDAIRQVGYNSVDVFEQDSTGLVIESYPGVESVDLIVTSPPFLDVVDYVGDNWLKQWFYGVDESWETGCMQSRDLDTWRAFMVTSLCGIARVLRSGGRAVLDVGEVRGGSLDLAQVVADLVPDPLEVDALYINDGAFTKLAHCYGVENNAKGTNTNRCLVLRKNVGCSY